MKKTWPIILLITIFVALTFSYFFMAAVNKTSEPKFCMKCHTMKPMSSSFNISIHGGNNKNGFRAAHCTDCHLPHKSTFGFLIAKGITGTKDILAETGLLGKIDLKKSLWERDRYVYDSGCLKCHQDIKNPSTAYGMDKDIRTIHEYYWASKRAGKNINCVDCHNDYTTPNFAHPEIYSIHFKAK